MSAYRPSYLGSRQTGVQPVPYQPKPFGNWPGPGGFPTVPSGAQLPIVRLQQPASRPSYDLAGIGPWLGAFYKVPRRANYELFLDLREAVPIINRAIIALRQLIGCPTLAGPDSVKDELNAWAEAVPANRSQIGFANWVTAHVDNMLTFGHANAEVVLNNSRNDVAHLLEVSPLTTALRPDGDSEHLNTVQYQAMGGTPKLLNPDLLVRSTYDVRTDDPYGTSVIFGLPLISEILIKMLRALGATWTRFGSPRYHINWTPPEGWDDPDGAKGTAFMQGIQGQFDAGMQAAQNGRVEDMYSAGDVKITVIGAEGEALEFTMPAHALIEQICTATGLPPFLLGIQSSRETMATVQALLLSETIESLRKSLTPGLTRLIDIRQRVAGKSRNFHLDWGEISVQDRYEDAHAEFMEEQARQFCISNDTELWRMGLYDRLYIARKYRPDLSEYTDQQLLAALPDLVEEPPELPKPMAGQGPGQGPAGSQRPTSNPAPGPRERVYALATANGNGRHG